MDETSIDGPPPTTPICPMAFQSAFGLERKEHIFRDDNLFDLIGYVSSCVIILSVPHKRMPPRAKLTTMRGLTWL